MTIKWSETERGFKIGEFYDRNSMPCTIQKSSLATEDCIWLGRNGSGVDSFARMHLTREQVADILPALIGFSHTGEF